MLVSSSVSFDCVRFYELLVNQSTKLIWKARVPRQMFKEDDSARFQLVLGP